MKEIYIKTQAEFDALPHSFAEYTQIIIKDSTERIIVVSNQDNSSVEARGNSRVEARGNSRVVARGNSRVVARDNSSVEARDNSSVEAWDNVGVHLYSDYATVTLFMFSACWKLAKGKVNRKSKTAIIIEPKPSDWFDANGIEKKPKIVLYKRVSRDLKTQEGTENETLWSIGATLQHSKWEPEKQEFGEGKFHACSRPYFTDEFRSEKGDRYIAIEVARKDTYEWPNPSYPHKIAFRKGTVLYEVDRFGKKL